jgi:hypothetical protein
MFVLRYRYNRRKSKGANNIEFEIWFGGKSGVPEILDEGVTEPPQSQCLLLSLTFKDTSVCILTFQSPFAQLVAEIGRHLQVFISDLSYSIIKIIPS